MSNQNLELTKNQAMVLGTLNRAKSPMSAYAILDELRSEGVKAPPQVYRALEKLVDGGLVHRLESLNAFVACSHKDCAGHGTAAFAICEVCGDVSEFTPDEVVKLLREWTKAEGFVLARTTIELRGTCKDCIAQAN